MNINSISFTKWISIGWWASFAFFIVQSFLIEFLALAATPWFGFLAVAAFTILTFSSGYDKTYRFSPYSGLLRMLRKEKK